MPTATSMAAAMTNSSRIAEHRPIDEAATAPTATVQPWRVGAPPPCPGAQRRPGRARRPAARARRRRHEDGRSVGRAAGAGGEHRHRHRLDVVGRGIVAAAGGGVGPRRRRQPAWPGDKPSSIEVWRRLASAMSIDVRLQCAGEVDRSDAAHHRHHLAGDTTGVSFAQRLGCAPSVEDRHLCGAPGVSERDAQQEAVELALGQPVRALLLDRVLGGDHHERRRQHVGRRRR